MPSHMSSMRKILPVLLCLAMLAGGAALFAQDAVAQAPAPEAPAAAPDAAAAPAPPKIDTGDTAWVLVSTALVLAMTAPGVGAVLWRDDAFQECVGDSHAELCCPLSDQCPVGAVGVLPRLRA